MKYFDSVIATARANSITASSSIEVTDGGLGTSASDFIRMNNIYDQTLPVGVDEETGHTPENFTSGISEINKEQASGSASYEARDNQAGEMQRTDVAQESAVVYDAGDLADINLDGLADLSSDTESIQKVITDNPGPNQVLAGELYRDVNDTDVKQGTQTDNNLDQPISLSFIDGKMTDPSADEYIDVQDTANDQENKPDLNAITKDQGNQVPVNNAKSEDLAAEVKQDKQNNKLYGHNNETESVIKNTAHLVRTEKQTNVETKPPTHAMHYDKVDHARNANDSYLKRLASEKSDETINITNVHSEARQWTDRATIRETQQVNNKVMSDKAPQQTLESTGGRSKRVLSGAYRQEEKAKKSKTAINPVTENIPTGPSDDNVVSSLTKTDDDNHRKNLARQVNTKSRQENPDKNAHKSEILYSTEPRHALDKSAVKTKASIQEKPGVVIGRVDITVVMPDTPNQTSTVTADQVSHDLASRNYLRRL